MNKEIHKYARYMNIMQETRWASIEEIQNHGTLIDLNADDYPASGLPLFSDAKTAYVDNKDTHTLIFGSTGSKKSRLFCMPLINILTKAGESFIATDPKGELFQKTSGLAKEKGYRTIVLNFRDIDHSDKWNPLSLPYDLYHSDQKEAAIGMLNDFITSISAPHTLTTSDMYWPSMASSLALANLILLMECARKDEANLMSLSLLSTHQALEDIKALSGTMDPTSIAGINYKGFFTAPAKTRETIISVLYSMLRIFNLQKSLTAMLSENTIDIRQFGREKTAVYLIIPDEKTTYHFLATTFIKQAYEIMIAEAQKEDNNKLPIRVNFILDEFCNIPQIPDMPSMISAARSRNMRYFLVVQSMHQLIGKYGEDAHTIKGNCDNWVFLTSRELSLLNELSDLCGAIHLADGTVRKLISVSELQRLSKEKGEALIISGRQYPFIAELPDIDDYQMFHSHPAVQLPASTTGVIPCFSVSRLFKSVCSGLQPAPFSKCIPNS
ncbi:MAG: type IV secretory system conjugative DNA transfer family protein [Lachnospiraceae bacterium]|nr:type IV secretory system conjugative DNA transfer family protein [Lachnospiraceae bacterium]